MQKIPDSAQDSPIDAFLECVARCLAERWLEREHSGSRDKDLPLETTTSVSAAQTTKPKPKSGGTRTRGR